MRKEESNNNEVLLMKCRTCGLPIAKLDNVYPEFKRVLLKDGIITPDKGMGIYDIRCFRKLLKVSEERSRVQEILRKAGQSG